MTESVNALLSQDQPRATETHSEMVLRLERPRYGKPAQPEGEPIVSAETEQSLSDRIEKIRRRDS
jgi:hypothetical protein